MLSRNVLFVLIMAVLVGVQAQATVINVDFENDPAASSSVTYSGQGAMPAPGGVWNSAHPSAAPDVYFWGECNYQNSLASGALVDSLGNPTGVTVSASGITATYTWTGFEPSPAPAWTTHHNLMNDWIIQESESTNAVVTISGLAGNGLYNLVVYGHSHEGGGNTVFTIGGNTQTTATTTSTDDHALTAGYDYLTFNNVSANGSGDIVINFHDAVGGNQGGFNGFQITSVPEPSAMIILASSILGLLAYAWRRHK